MRGKIEDKLFEYDGQIMKLTMSFGAYTMRSETETSIESIIDFADRNLLHAKQNGRNMVISS
jgi:PleD family two-component response regulator